MGYVATSDFVPLSGDPQERRGNEKAWVRWGTLYHHWLVVHPRCFIDFVWSMQVFLKFKVKVICLPFANS